jgi:hypothetical protein
MLRVLNSSDVFDKRIQIGNLKGEKGNKQNL